MAHTPTTRILATQKASKPQESPGARFEAPLATHPYPVDRCAGACMDTRDLDLEDGLEPYRNG